MVCQLNLISKKSPKAKMRKQCKNYQTLKNYFSLLSLTRHFTKFIFLEQLTAMPQFNMQNIFFFFLSSHHDMTRALYFICIIFVKKYNYILANISSESSRVIFPFVCLHPVGQIFLCPSKFCNHLKHSAK